MTRRARLIVMALVVLVTPPLLADFQTALEAYNAGDYETAYREWLPLAEKNSPGGPVQHRDDVRARRGPRNKFEDGHRVVRPRCGKRLWPRAVSVG